MHPLLFTCITSLHFIFFKVPGTKSLMHFLICCLSLQLQNLTRAPGHYPSSMCLQVLKWSLPHTDSQYIFIKEWMNNLKLGFYGRTQNPRPGSQGWLPSMDNNFDPTMDPIPTWKPQLLPLRIDDGKKKMGFVGLCWPLSWVGWGCKPRNQNLKNI